MKGVESEKVTNQVELEFNLTVLDNRAFIRYFDIIYI